MHVSKNNFLVLQFLPTISSSRRKSAWSLSIKLCYFCPASDVPCLYESAEAKSSSLIYVRKTTFYDKSSFLKNNWRRVSNRLRLFIIKPFHILTIKN